MQSIVSRVGVIAIALTAVTACGGGGGSTPAPSTVGGSNPVTITISGQNGLQSFTPNPASAGGQMVVFRNTDTVAHRVVLNDGTIDTGEIAPGATSRTVQMPSAGTNYHCSLHAGMTGAVAGTTGDAPACEGPYCSGSYY
jgi:plastocyanin